MFVCLKLQFSRANELDTSHSSGQKARHQSLSGAHCYRDNNINNLERMTAPNEPFHRSHVSSKQSELKRHYIVQRGNWESFQFKNFVFTWNKHRQKDDHVSQAHTVVRMSCGNVSISCKFSTLNLIVALFSPSVPSEVILSLCQSQLNSNLMLIHVIIWLRQLIHHIGYSGLNFFELLSKSHSLHKWSCSF